MQIDKVISYVFSEYFTIIGESDDKNITRGINYFHSVHLKKLLKVCNQLNDDLLEIVPMNECLGQDIYKPRTDHAKGDDEKNDNHDKGDNDNHENNNNIESVNVITQRNDSDNNNNDVMSYIAKLCSF